MFFFQKNNASEDDEQITKALKMVAIGTCPRVILSEGGLQYGICNLGMRIEKKIKIKNLSHCEVLVESPNLSQFRTTPSQFRLAKDEEKELLITFKPKNLGKIDLKTEFLVNKQYPLLFRLEGHGISQGKPFKSILSDKSGTDNKLGSLMTTSMVQLGKARLGGKETSVENAIESSMGHSKVILPKLTSQSLVKIDYLKESRLHRLKVERDKRLKIQMSEVEEKIRETIPLL